MIAGSTAVFQLDVQVKRLLVLCAGASTQACAVLKQCEPRGGCLQGVDVVTLLDTGLRAVGLCDLGYFLENVKEQTGATKLELRQLGFV